MRSRKSTPEQAGILTSSRINKLAHLPSRRFVLSMALLLLPFIVSCAALLEMSAEKPEIRITSLRLDRGKPVTEGRIPLIITLTVRNRNRFSIETNRISYLIMREDHVLARGREENLPPLEGGEAVKVELPLVISVAELVRAAQLVFRGKKLTLTVRGSASFNTPIGEVTVPFEKKFEKDPKKLLRLH